MRRFEEAESNVEEAWNRWIVQTGAEPTLDEIRRVLGYRSVASVHRYVASLIAKGRIRPRNLRASVTQLYQQNQGLMHEIDALRSVPHG